MKFKLHLPAFVFLSILCFSVPTFGQLYEVSFDEKLEKSALIIEGKVVDTKSYLADNGDIYTANKVELFGLLKGDYRDKYVTVTTWGGQVDDQLQTWTHLLSLQKGDYGFFFLEPTTVSVIPDHDFPISFDAYSGVQGFLRLSQNDAKSWTAEEPFHSYFEIEKDIFEPIARKTGQKVEYLIGNSSPLRSGIRYHFTNISFDGTSVTFDIFVNSLVGTKELYEAGIRMGYNTAFFGSNIATNGNLEIQNAGISSSSVYAKSQSNITSSKVKIELVASTTSGLTSIGSAEQLLAKGKISIQNILATPGVSFDVAEMMAMNKFYADGMTVLFDTVVVEGDFVLHPFACPDKPVIDNVYTNAAQQTLDHVAAGVQDISASGIQGVIIIQGNFFGIPDVGQATPADYRVQFSNAGADGGWMSPLEGDYISWNNNEIVVKVPSIGYFGCEQVSSSISHAGSGKVRVKKCNANFLDNCFGTSEDEIYVEFSATNREIVDANNQNIPVRVKLLNRNGTGGYSFVYLGADMIGNAAAKAAFERALSVWRCRTQNNYDVREFGNVVNFDGVCNVIFGALPAGTSASTRALTTTTPENCAGQPVEFTYLPSSRIIFRKKLDNQDPVEWHFTTDTPPLNWFSSVDFETIALHEIGHAIMLNHTNNPDNVMTPAVASYRRDLTNDDEHGGDHIALLSSEIGNCNSPHMDLVSLAECQLEIENPKAAYNKAKFEVSPNPFTNFVSLLCKHPNLYPQQYTIRLQNSVGESLFVKQIKENEGQITFSGNTFPAGVYLISVQDMSNGLIVFRDKLIKL